MEGILDYHVTVNVEHQLSACEVLQSAVKSVCTSETQRLSLRVAHASSAYEMACETLRSAMKSVLTLETQRRSLQVERQPLACEALPSGINNIRHFETWMVSPKIEGHPLWSSDELVRLFKLDSEITAKTVQEEEQYRKRTRKAVLRFVRRFWCLFTRCRCSEMEANDVERTLARAKRLLKAILQILELQLCIQYLLNTLLIRINSECLEPSILSCHWVKRHGPRPPRKLALVRF